MGAEIMFRRKRVQKDKRALTFSINQIFEKEEQKKIFHFISKCVQFAQHLQHIVTEELNKNISHHLDLPCICNYSHLAKRKG